MRYDLDKAKLAISELSEMKTEEIFEWVVKNKEANIILLFYYDRTVILFDEVYDDGFDVMFELAIEQHLGFNDSVFALIKAIGIKMSWVYQTLESLTIKQS